MSSKCPDIIDTIRSANSLLVVAAAKDAWLALVSLNFVESNQLRDSMENSITSQVSIMLSYELALLGRICEVP